METPLIPSETESRAHAFLHMGGEAGQTGKRYTQRCIALLNFLGRNSPLASAVGAELQRLHIELGVHEQSEAKLLEAFSEKLQTNEQAQLATAGEIARLKAQLLNHEQLEELLREELESFQGQNGRFAEVTAALSLAQAQAAALQQSETQLHTQLAALRDLEHTQGETIEGLNQQIVHLQSIEETLKSELAGAQQAQAELKEAAALNPQLQVQVDNLKESEAHALEGLASLRERIAGQTEELHQAQALLAEHAATLAELHTQLRGHQERELALTEEVTRLTAQTQADSQAEASLKKDLDTLRGMESYQEEEIERLQTLLEGQEATRIDLQTEVDALRLANTTLVEQAGGASAVGAQLAASQETQVVLQEQVTHLLAVETQLTDQTQRLTQELDRREATHRQLSQRVEELRLRESQLTDELAVHEQIEQRLALDSARAADDFSLPHPFQPLTIDNEGRVKFWSNALVHWVVQNGPFKHTPFPAHFSMSEREQVAQLLGMELDVFSLQPFVRPYTAQAAAMMDLIPLPCAPLEPQAQDVVLNGEEGVGFRANALVRFLVSQSLLTPAQIEALPVHAYDRAQFNQLMGQSLTGVGGIPPANEGGRSDSLAA